MAKIFLILSAFSGLLVVITGAFGAHGLKGKISESLLSAFQTGTHYQMFHTLALFGLAILMMHLADAPKTMATAGICWLTGIVLFSGSLYGLVLGAPGWFGPITPIGGLLFIIGWLCLMLGAWRL